MNENEEIILTHDELDAIGEIMNISMGSSATAVSAMLDRQVTITTPNIQQVQFGMLDSSDLEPAILVKIKYVEGIRGTDVIILRRHDMQVILNLLMGNDVDDENFEFDEMSISAACEVMNQMMGASATALSEILGRAVNISTPVAALPESKEAIASEFDDINPEQMIVAVSFQLSIKDVMNSSFSCFLPTPLAREMINAAAGGDSIGAAEPAPRAPEMPQMPEMPPMPEMPQMQTPPPVPEPMQMPPMQTPSPVPEPMQMPQMPAAPSMPEPMQMPQMQQPMQMPPMPMQMPDPQMMQQMMQQQMQQMMQQQQMQMQQQMEQQMQQMQQQMQPRQYNAGMQAQQAPVNIKHPQFPSFGANDGLGGMNASNMNLLMSVPLDVSVVIGKARRKIKDIMEFGQGTVVELDKQTGAPAEIMVNGQLLAYGDVIVIGDNFGVRITEIVSTEELLESLHIVDVNM